MPEEHIYLSKDIAHIIQTYGYAIAFENLWKHLRVDELLRKHEPVPLCIACEFEYETLFWNRVDEFREFLFSEFQTKIRELGLCSEMVELMIMLYIESPNEAEDYYQRLCSLKSCVLTPDFRSSIFPS